MADTKLFVELFITVLLERMVDLVARGTSAGVRSQLRKLDNMVLVIRSFLIVVESKYLNERDVHEWLLNLEDVACDIDDALNDFAIEYMRRQLREEISSASTRNKALEIISYFVSDASHQHMYFRKMSSKLNVITDRLDRCLKEATSLGLRSEQQISYRTRVIYKPSLREASSVIVGRQTDREAMLQNLLTIDDTNGRFHVLAIVGIGGIGKTHLARFLYDDLIHFKAKEHFELRAWVCVSDDFDVFNISQAIYQAVSGENKDFANNLNLLQVALSDKLSMKRFLLVLDDVWNENYTDWELLQRPFAVGAPGSKVLVTTRKGTVASVMDSVQTYHLQILLDEEALSLLAVHAGVDFDSDPELKAIGEHILKMSGGLPLALKALGGVLRTKGTVGEWEEVLRNVSENRDIVHVLRQSYHDLSPLLKQMFIYCSLFPQDYDFDKDELVLLWVAQGFLRPSGANTSLEGIGLEIFQELESKSFFMNSTEKKSIYKMHDLLNDLANSLTDQFLFLSDDHDNHALERVRHISFTRQRFGVYSKLEALKKTRRLRTFIALPVSTDDCQIYHISDKVLDELLPKLQFLRVLSLSHYSITRVPKSIGTLKHMRYLNFSCTNITFLPEQVSDLYNLQILLLHGCKSLVSLPKSFSKLVNLRHLDIDDTPLLKKLPSGIGGLISLQTLSKVIVEGSNGFKISMLGDLDLKGQLSIKGLHKVKNAKEALEANIQQKNGLVDLMLEWSDVIDDSRNKRNEYEVLEKLKPHTGLTSLKILFYGGTQFPSWIGNSSFIALTQLTLRGCESCTCLPTLGHLKSLQKLLVESMKNVKTIDELFLEPTTSNTGGNAFPSLEVLEFRNMENWVEWTLNEGDNNISASSFSCLREISLVDCPKLVVKSTKLIPSVEVLHTERCSDEVLRSMVSMCPSIVRLTLDSIEGLTQLYRDDLERLGTAEYLRITKCHELRFLWESELESHNILGSLQKLEVSSCKKLESLGENEVDLGMSLKHVILSNCESLKRYDCPEGIERLEIRECLSITSLTFPPVHGRSSTLKNLDIQKCHNLKGDWLLDNFLSSLESLEMVKLPNVKTFPKRPFDHLTSLIISGCDNLESIPEEDLATHAFCRLTYLEIISCQSLKSFPYQHLATLTSLEKLVISDCPCMDNSFPCGLWPRNLSSLRTGRLKKPMSKWQHQNYPASLVNLCLIGENSGVNSFASAEDTTTSNDSTSSFLLPPSLTILNIIGFRTLESFSDGLQHLTSLQQLVINSCPNLDDLPESLLSSLSSLKIDSSLKLQEKCRTKKGNYWHKISHIPELEL